jgi:hypothetical protein
LPLLEVPGREREREVDADNEVGVAICLGDQQLDELGAGPAAFEPNQLPVDGLGQPERSALGRFVPGIPLMPWLAYVRALLLLTGTKLFAVDPEYQARIWRSRFESLAARTDQHPCQVIPAQDPLGRE